MTGPAAFRVTGLLCAGGVLSALVALAAFTAAGLAALPNRLPPGPTDAMRPRIETRDRVTLNRSYAGQWNVHDRVALHEVPPLLRAAFIAAEDRGFHAHGGVDWAARIAAVVQNLRAGRAVRGASTISEQVVRMIRPRPRTIWSRWLEGFDAARLERRFGKHAILEFYLNQVPFADNRRGVVQAARHYFDRDLDTLSARETLTLAVLVRAPSRLDPWRAPGAAQGAVTRLAAHLQATGELADGDLDSAPLVLAPPMLALDAPHVVRHLMRDPALARTRARVATTLDAAVQRGVQALLTERLRALSARGARHGAALVADHRDGAILAWVVATAPGAAPTQIDTVTAPRQPGSTLKPFVYALALERGWTAATMIEDAPFAQAVGTGQHAYRNYSRVHYGPVSVREALGSSLNVPAVKALAFAGARDVLARLNALGIRSLANHPDVYGDGLALGNGEVSLRELVEAYAALANGGEWRALRVVDGAARTHARRVLDPGASDIVADILSDPDARALEFGSGGVLALPVATAVKTGTSSDHRDAWAIGFDHRYVVGVWMGDLERRAMDRIAGASGPALVMRGIFAQLNRDGATRALTRHAPLVHLAVCADDGRAPHASCRRTREELFHAGRGPDAHAPPSAADGPPRIRQPGNGLVLARDPRVPADAQRFRFTLAPGVDAAQVEWYVDGRPVARSREPHWLWPLAGGTHVVHAVVHPNGGGPAEHTRAVRFEVR